MINETPDQLGKLALLSNQPQNEVVTSQEKKSYIQDYKVELGKRFALAKTSTELEEILDLSQIVHELDTKDKQLAYSQELAEIQLREEKRKLVFQQSQQVVASIIAVGIGIYLIPIAPLPSILFLVLGLAKSLGYSLGEVGSLLNELKGFPKSSGELLSNENKQEVKSEESENAEF